MELRWKRILVWSHRNVMHVEKVLQMKVNGEWVDVPEVEVEVKHGIAKRKEKR